MAMKTSVWLWNQVWFQQIFVTKIFQQIFFCISAIYLAQIFGLFPCRNLHSKSTASIDFKWKSFRTLYSTVLSIYVIVAAVLNSYKHFRSGSIKAPTINGVIFYASSAISCVLFDQLDWKRFTIEWCRFESIFLDDEYKYPPTSRSLKQKIYLCFALESSALCCRWDTESSLHLSRMQLD